MMSKFYTRTGFTQSGIVLGLALLMLGLVNCTANVQAEPATPEPTAGIQNSVKPGDPTPTPNLTPNPTAMPGDPNAPVSSDTPITVQPPTNRTTISGTITDANSKPIARATITIPKSSAIIPEMAYISNAQGKYTISVPPGEYTLAVFAEGYTSFEQTVNTRTEKQVTLNWVLK